MNQDKSHLIASILSRYGGLGLEPNLQAWSYFYCQAQDNKAWEQYLVPAWFDQASVMSIEMAEKYTELPTAILAAKAYIYSHYRANTKIKGMVVDPMAYSLWESFNGDSL